MRTDPDWPALDRLQKEWRPDGLVVGDPMTLDGGDQPIRRFAHAFAARTERALRAAGACWSTSAPVRSKPRSASPPNVPKGAGSAATRLRWTRSPPRSSSSAGWPRRRRRAFRSDAIATPGNTSRMSPMTSDRRPRPPAPPADARRPAARRAGRAARSRAATACAGAAEPVAARRARRHRGVHAVLRAVDAHAFESSSSRRTRLGADVLNFDASTSSTSKGETAIDTLRNIEAMGVRRLRRAPPGRRRGRALAAGSGPARRWSTPATVAARIRRRACSTCSRSARPRAAISRTPEGADRRRRAPLARGALRPAGAAHARRARDPRLRPAIAAAGRRHAARLLGQRGSRRRARRRRRGDDAAPATRADAGRPGRLDRRLPPRLRPDRAAPAPRRARMRSCCIRAR